MSTVLLVDDDVVFAGHLARLLRREFDVLIAESSASALLTLERARVHALVVDYDLRGENGLWLLATAKRRFPTTKRMLMSARRSVVGEDAPGALFEHFFVKPFLSIDLLAALGRGVASPDA